MTATPAPAPKNDLASSLRRGVVSGLAGVTAMTAWQKLVVFGALWPGDVTTTVALGMNPPPWRWSRQDLAIDLADKLVLAQTTGAVYDRLDDRKAVAA